MRIWAVANQKGGVGKTTTTLALGRGLAALGHRVLLIDLDPHASLSRAFGVPVDPPPAGVLELFGAPPADLSSLCHASSIHGLDYVCAQSALATLERRSANQPGLGLALQNALARHQGQHDYILLDCAPTLGLLMINALAAADRLIIPTQAEPLALHGLEDGPHWRDGRALAPPPAADLDSAHPVRPPHPRRQRIAAHDAGSSRHPRVGRRHSHRHPHQQRRRPDPAKRW